LKKIKAITTEKMKPNVRVMGGSADIERSDVFKNYIAHKSLNQAQINMVD